MQSQTIVVQGHWKSGAAVFGASKVNAVYQSVQSGNQLRKFRYKEILFHIHKTKIEDSHMITQR